MHYVAIVEESDGNATGVWFPDLPGCFAAGDTTDEALLNAEEAVKLYAETLGEEGRLLPPARPLTLLRRDAAVAREIDAHLVALIPAPRVSDRPAAE